MCYHYSLSKSPTDIVQLTGAQWETEGFTPFFHSNGFNFPGMPVLTAERPGSIQCYHWGLIPHWVQSLEDAAKIRAQTLNARSETVFEKPAFRSYVQNRCVVLADGFFEWMEYRKKKYPHYVQLKGEELFGFAGLYAHWTDKETGEILHSFTILTTDANPLMAKIHNSKKRMPVILRRQEWQHWLEPRLSKEQMQQMLLPTDDSDMQARSISRLITSRGADTNVPEVVAPQVYPELELVE